MLLRGTRVIVRPLSRADLDEIETWTPFTDPLYLSWNRFPWRLLGKDLWFELEALDPLVERYAVVDLEGRVIGMVGLVGAQKGASPELSIFLGAEFCGQGLGTDALQTLLRQGFEERVFASVRLQVAATNRRAQRAYEKCGFRRVGQHYRLLDESESLAFLEEPVYSDMRQYYRREGGRTYLLFYDMELCAADWSAAQRRTGQGTGHGRNL
ncbi:MAG: GNAT family N-acetyltransferase [Anaerolineae bacterium]|nr:GNAT family N-acetyltransferase [Anaerolineae bacterium]